MCTTTPCQGTCPKPCPRPGTGRAAALTAALAAVLLAAPALAQGPTVTASSDPRPGEYGGGLIELFMTGRDPGRGARPAYSETPAPAPARGYAAPAPDYRPRQGSLGGRSVLYATPEMEDEDPLEPARAAPRRLAPRAMAREVDPEFRRTEIEYNGPHAPGTLVIDTPKRHLYLVQSGGRAIRYGIGVGRPGFAWAGVRRVTRKAEWPGWTPPPEMLKRRPDLPRHMVGGPANPLGARALYLGSTLYRIHGTNEPHTIGHAVSSGCIRLLNEDVKDLYGRVPVGAKVVVI